MLLCIALARPMSPSKDRTCLAVVGPGDFSDFEQDKSLNKGILELRRVWMRCHLGIDNCQSVVEAPGPRPLAGS